MNSWASKHKLTCASCTVECYIFGLSKEHVNLELNFMFHTVERNLELFGRFKNLAVAIKTIAKFIVHYTEFAFKRF